MMTALPRFGGAFPTTVDAGWSSPVARQAHNLKVTGSNPVPATIFTEQMVFSSKAAFFWAAFCVSAPASIFPPSRRCRRLTGSPAFGLGGHGLRTPRSSPEGFRRLRPWCLTGGGRHTGRLVCRNRRPRDWDAISRQPCSNTPLGWRSGRN